MAYTDNRQNESLEDWTSIQGSLADVDTARQGSSWSSPLPTDLAYLGVLVYLSKWNRGLRGVPQAEGEPLCVLRLVSPADCCHSITHIVPFSGAQDQSPT